MNGTFEFYYLSYVEVEVLKKVLHICISVFDHFAGHPQGLCLIICCKEILCLFGIFLMIYCWLILLGEVQLNMFFIW